MKLWEKLLLAGGLAGCLCMPFFDMSANYNTQGLHAFAARSLGNAHIEAGRLDSAEFWYKSSLSAGVSPETLYSLGLVNMKISNKASKQFHFLEAQVRLEDAEMYLQMATMLKPFRRVWMAYNTLGNLYAKKRLLKSAVACWNQAIQIQPSSYIAPYNMALYLVNLGQLDLAYNLLLPFTQQSYPPEKVVWLIDIIQKRKM